MRDSPPGGSQEEYGSRFERWDERAAVRVKPQPVMDTPAPDVLYFPPELVPVLRHPLVAERGERAVHDALAQHLYHYLHFTVELEQVAIIPVAAGIARGRSGLNLPERMRADAYKIVTDEAWHAQLSYDLIRQVEARSGVAWPTRAPRPSCGGSTPSAGASTPGSGGWNDCCSRSSARRSSRPS
ncbi:diiron oxygenase [Streptosporangium algeriense]|uniref:Diiron oxygenase n=1 Tax=Streptosporangium algeriense TaxID=1682748 RepID=A0ABW3DLQ0_9ACTN